MGLSRYNFKMTKIYRHLLKVREKTLLDVSKRKFGRALLDVDILWMNKALWDLTIISKSPRPSKGDFWLRRCENFFVFSIFDDHAVLCAVKSDKRKFKDKPFINRWSASQIKHITAKSNSKLRQKILFDIDYQSFADVASLFVSRCRRSRWRFFSNEYLASTLSSHFWAV